MTDLGPVVSPAVNLAFTDIAQLGYRGTLRALAISGDRVR